MKKIILFITAISILSCSPTSEKLPDTNGFGPFEGQSVYQEISLQLMFL